MIPKGLECNRSIAIIELNGGLFVRNPYPIVGLLEWVIWVVLLNIIVYEALTKN